MQSLKIAPSILSADFSRLKDEIQAVEAAGADWLHVDVMDGHFVPNITIGPVVVEWVRKVTKIPIDVHLMITDPDKYAPEFIKAGADWISVHPDTCRQSECNAQQNPRSRRQVFYCRKSGRAFEKSRRLLLGHRHDADDDRVSRLRRPGFHSRCAAQDRGSQKAIDQSKLAILVEVDGGIKADNIDRVVPGGGEVIVSGSGIFKTPNYADTIRQMREAVGQL